MVDENDKVIDYGSKIYGSFKTTLPDGREIAGAPWLEAHNKLIPYFEKEEFDSLSGDVGHFEYHPGSKGAINSKNWHNLKEAAIKEAQRLGLDSSDKSCDWLKILWYNLPPPNRILVPKEKNIIIAQPKWLRDPSGYVYETINENRIENVTVTLYLKNDTSNKLVLWDAREFGQINPQTTDTAGKYGWDVPDGTWQVKYNKDDYNDTHSEIIYVPPPRTDVNINLKSKSPPEINSIQTLVNNSKFYIDIQFDKYIMTTKLSNDTVKIYSNSTDNSTSSLYKGNEIDGNILIMNMKNDENNHTSLTDYIRFETDKSTDVFNQSLVMFLNNNTIYGYNGLGMNSSSNIILNPPIIPDYNVYITNSSNFVYSNTTNLSQPFVVGDDIRAIAKTNNNLIDKVNFFWLGPNNLPYFTDSIFSYNNFNSSKFVPTIPGNWTIKIEFVSENNVLERQQIAFDVIDEEIFSLFDDHIEDSFTELDGFKNNTFDNSPIQKEDIVANNNSIPVTTSQNLTYIKDMTINLDAYDSDLDTMKFIIIKQPLNGIIDNFNSSSGSFMYIPYPAFNGIDTISFIASDGKSNSTESPIYISVNQKSISDNNTRFRNIPIANAGDDINVQANQTVFLNGSLSLDPNKKDSKLNYKWKQIDKNGYDVYLEDSDTSTPYFNAPVVNDTTILQFELTVTNSEDITSKANTVTVIVGKPNSTNNKTIEDEKEIMEIPINVTALIPKNVTEFKEPELATNNQTEIVNENSKNITQKENDTKTNYIFSPINIKILLDDAKHALQSGNVESSIIYLDILKDKVQSDSFNNNTKKTLGVLIENVVQSINKNDYDKSLFYIQIIDEKLEDVISTKGYDRDLDPILDNKTNIETNTSSISNGKDALPIQNNTNKTPISNGTSIDKIDVLETYVFEKVLGESSNEIGYLGVPLSVGVDNHDAVYVSDYGNDNIQKFDSEGNFITSWGESGSGQGQFNYADGIAVDNNDNVFVSDSENHRIQKFDSEGNYITSWGKLGSGQGQFKFPEGIAVDNTYNVFVSDYENDNIQKFDSEGNFITSWGELGSGQGQFSAPQGIAVDSHNAVYVSDYGNHRIQKFDSEGNFIISWGELGSGEGQFKYPDGITVDNNNAVYVSDSENNRIQKFDSEGNYITSWGESGRGKGQFSTPEDIVVDGKGFLFVVDGNTDNDNYRIQIFKPMQNISSYESNESSSLSPQSISEEKTQNQIPDPIVKVSESVQYKEKKYNDVPNSKDMNLDSFTISLWFNTKMQSKDKEIFLINKGGIGIEEKGKNLNFGIFLIGNKIIGGFETITGKDYFVKSIQDLNNGKWHNAILTFNTNTNLLKLYIDGKEVDSNSLNTNIQPDATGKQPIRLGANSLYKDPKPNGYYSGKLDDVKIWKIGFTKQQIQDLYQKESQNGRK